MIPEKVRVELGEGGYGMDFGEDVLGGGFKHFFMFTAIPREMIQFDSIFFNWVETTNKCLLVRNTIYVV